MVFRKLISRYLKPKKLDRILCQRIFKCTFNATIALILCLNSKTRKILGDEPGMLPLIAVITHPGRRLGTMIETCLLCSSGILLGNGYAILGKFLAQKAVGSEVALPDKSLLLYNYEGYRAGLGILVVFEIAMLFFHGWMRSISHKFFGMVFQLFLVVHFAFTDEIETKAYTTFKTYTIPFFLGIGLSLASNLLLFPEFGSSHMGWSMIQALNEFHNTLDSTIQFFISFEDSDNHLYTVKPLSLAQLTQKKSILRKKLNTTQAVLHECMYEISYSFSSPAQLKPTIEILNSELSYLSALINASQLQFRSLIGKGTQSDNASTLLKQVLHRIKTPIHQLQSVMSQKMFLIKQAIGYSYDVNILKISKSPNTVLKDVDLSSIDFETEVTDFVKEMAKFDVTFREELKNLSSEYDNYFSPNDDMFLLSSFLINLRESADSVCSLLKEAQKIYGRRMEREKKGIFGKKIWVLFLGSTEKFKRYININKSNLLGGAEIASLNGTYIPPGALAPDDEPTNSSHKKQMPSSLDGQVNLKTRSNVADRVISSWSDFYREHKAHFRFGFQITTGLMLSSFPMFVPESREWFKEYRGTWIAFVCILVLEPEVGSTFFVFFLRGVGVISGAAWGYLSYVAAINQTNPYLEVFVTVIGAIPGFYFFVGTPYVKAAIIGIISIYVVLLSSVIPSDVGGTIAENFGKRCLAMLYGGLVALVCQLIFFPIKARDELIKEVAFSTGAISKLMLLYATGIDGEDIEFCLSEERFAVFSKLLASSKASLTRADIFRKTAKKEPRLKGKFDDISKIFYEIIFILREILDRVENISKLRRVYGSAIIEEFNSVVHPYRRQLSASLNNSFKVVQLALLTKAPLPQYLPSAKIAHKRLFEKVREAVEEKYSQNNDLLSESEDSESEVPVNLERNLDDRIGNNHQEELLRARFLSWNATSAATEVIIDYTEELLELTKLLVGVHEFKYGFLSRTLYSDYAASAARGYKDVVNESGNVGRRVFDIEQDEEDEGPEFDDDNFNPVGLVGDDVHSRNSNLSNGFRRRVFSIGSWGNGGDSTSARSLGEYSGEFDDSDDDDDDNIREIPLSLIRVISKKGH